MVNLKVGDQAPNFTLLSDEENKISLEDFRGKKVILYFYPKDSTPGCTKEACDFRDLHAQFAAKQVVILGVSKDSVKSHVNFKQKHQLPFSLLVDDQGDVCTAYGVLDNKTLFGKTFLGIKRMTFLIDEQGLIQALWPKVKVPGHVLEILNKLNVS